MLAKEGKRLARFSVAVRGSSLKRLRLVPKGFENWRIVPGAMSFGDLAQHLVDADRWLFKKLEVRTLDPMAGEAGVVNIAERSEYLDLLEELEQLGQARASLLESMSESQFEEEITDIRFGGQTTVWWVIVRGNLDHEIHHRGEIWHLGRHRVISSKCWIEENQI
jgi:uncharacterized damage-inducible protein DinB